MEAQENFVFFPPLFYPRESALLIKSTKINPKNKYLLLV